MHRVQTKLLACAGRLLLEYNESTGKVHRVLTATARKLTDDKLDLAVRYGNGFLDQCSNNMQTRRASYSLMHVKSSDAH